MQQYHGTERPAIERRVTRLLKRLVVLAVLASLVGVVIYASTLPSVQKQFTGRRGKAGEGPVPVAAARAQLTNVPLYLEGVGTA
jgi:hypothetical protein